MTPTFYPPKLNSFLVRFAQGLAPLATPWLYQFRLRVSPDEVKQVRSLSQAHLLFMPNHPTFQDPIVMFTLSAVLRQPFHYLAAIELFQGTLGSVVQRLGVYSIRRGLVDRVSVSQTIELLSQPQSRLVIFAEGGCSFQNDTVMPFRSGAIQLALQSLNRMAKQGQDLPALYVIPVAIKYRYTRDMAPVIQTTLRRLEQAVGLQTAQMTDAYQRLRAIAQRVLAQVEQDYGLHTPQVEELSWNQRIVRLREQVVARCEQELGLATNAAEPIRERTYRIQYALKLQEEALESESNLSANEVMDPKADERAYNYRLMEKSVKRLLNFDAIYDGYVAEQPTPERFLDTLVRLEREVFDIDQPPPKGFREAWVKLGPPICLTDSFNLYQRDRAGTVNQLTLDVQQAVQRNLDSLNHSDA